MQTTLTLSPASPAWGSLVFDGIDAIRDVAGNPTANVVERADPPGEDVSRIFTEFDISALAGKSVNAAQLQGTLAASQQGGGPALVELRPLQYQPTGPFAPDEVTLFNSLGDGQVLQSVQLAAGAFALNLTYDAVMDLRAALEAQRTWWGLGIRLADETYDPPATLWSLNRATGLVLVASHSQAGLTELTVTIDNVTELSVVINPVTELSVTV